LGNKNGGNSNKLLGDNVGGVMDDWVLHAFNIPAVTAELGNDEYYTGEWLVKNKETALKIM
jgi:hypothetical protein